MLYPKFTFIPANSSGLSDVGSYANPALVDIDGDGDLDAFVGNSYGNTLFFRNTGTINNQIFAVPAENPFGLSYSNDAKPTFIDIDEDGDFDALIGDGNGNTLFFRNTGTPTNPVFAAPETNPFGLSDVGADAGPCFADIDEDGDFDAFVGNGDGNTVFFRNTGTANTPMFAASVTNPFGLSNTGFAAKPSFGDIDNDGDLDAFVGNVLISVQNLPGFWVKQR